MSESINNNNDTKSETATPYKPARMATWSVYHPIGVVMITLAVVVLGSLTYTGLSVDLLPSIVKPEVRVRVIDPGVPAKIMEDKITRQLEEQLAITEDAISVESSTQEGRSAVDLVFEYGKDIDIVLRDASTRLDRAKRFLPSSIEPPIIYKRDPSQLPVLEMIIASDKIDAIKLRSWVDHHFSKWFYNIPGVAAVEPGGGLVREIHVIPNTNRLAGYGLKISDIIAALKNANIEEPGGRMYLGNREISSRTGLRFKTLNDIRTMPLRGRDGSIIQLQEVAKIKDSHEDEILRVRLNNTPGIKVSIQKQPNANTVTVAKLVKQKLADLYAEKIIPAHVKINISSDQSIFIKNALDNARNAVVLGAILAMLVVYVFLGNIRRTLIIGTAIPIGVVVTFLLMEFFDLNLNIMTVGGLAVGIGLLVDNTIVMLENIYRHQKQSGATSQSAIVAASEVNSAIIASTSTNLAAIIPFLFISGLLGLLFKELIFTISAAILASMIVALTLVPALSNRVKINQRGRIGQKVDKLMLSAQSTYANLVQGLLKNLHWKLIIIASLCLALAWSLYQFQDPKKQKLLPGFDTGEISVFIQTDPGINLASTDKIIQKIENLIYRQKDVIDVITISGGFIFGRTTVERHNSAYIEIRIAARNQRDYSSSDWIRKFRRDLNKMRIAGLKARIYPRGIRGLNLFSRGSDDISLRIQGPDLEQLDKLADWLKQKVKSVKGLSNVEHSMEEHRNELLIKPDIQRISALGLTPKSVSDAIRIAINGEKVGDFIEGDYSHAIKVRLSGSEIYDLQKLKSLIVGHSEKNKLPIKLVQVASFEFPTAPYEIRRDRQQRMVEISARLDRRVATGKVALDLEKIKQEFRAISPQGYALFDAGITSSLKKQSKLTLTLVLLAIFLVFVVLAVQYESLRDPVIIILSVPFTLIGVWIGLQLTGLGISTSVWLGVIMLIGIVVNNAIVLIEYIEIARSKGAQLNQAIVEAARLRLRPILMTTLTTIAGLSPLAFATGMQGSEMLRPLAVTIVFGLSFSLIISLILVPIIYRFIHNISFHSAKQIS